MARQVGKGFTINLSASQRAGTRALQELHVQGQIPTANWFNLRSESIVDESPNSSITRNLYFTLEGGQRVEVRVQTGGRSSLTETEESLERRDWRPVFVFVENNGKMEAICNYLDTRPWYRMPDCDKPAS